MPRIGTDAVERRFEAPLQEAIGASAWAREFGEGAGMTLDEALTLARTQGRPPTIASK